MLAEGLRAGGFDPYLLIATLAAMIEADSTADIEKITRQIHDIAGYSYRFDHFNHLELQMTMWMPLALLALHRWLKGGRWTSAAALALCGVAQVYSSLYYSVFLAVLLAVVGVGLVLVHRPPVRRLAVGGVIVVLIAAPLAWPVAHAFSAAQPMKGDRSIEEVGFYSAEPLDYLRTHRFTGVWNGVLPPPLPERALFPGAIPLALAAIAFVPPVKEYEPVPPWVVVIVIVLNVL